MQSTDTWNVGAFKKNKPNKQKPPNPKTKPQVWSGIYKHKFGFEIQSLYPDCTKLLCDLVLVSQPTFFHLPNRSSGVYLPTWSRYCESQLLNFCTVSSWNNDFLMPV